MGGRLDPYVYVLHPALHSMRLIVLDRDTVDSMRFVALKRRKCGGNGVRSFGFWKGNFIP